MSLTLFQKQHSEHEKADFRNAFISIKCIKFDKKKRLSSLFCDDIPLFML